MAPASGSRWERRSTGWLVVALAVALMLPTLGFHRLGFDDHWLWSDDSPLRTPSVDTLRYVFLELDARARHDIGTEYLPVRDVVVMLDMAVWGDNEQGPHATQLLLFALTVFGLGRLLIRFGMRAEHAWLATLLWAIHPLHVESVAWISERKGILAGLFVVVCGHGWIRYRRGGSARWLVVAILTAIAAVWSKGPAMVAPAAFAAWDLLLLPPARRRWIAILAIGGAAALAAVPVIAVAHDAGVISSEEEIVEGGRFGRALGAQGHYVESLVLARTPSLSYPIHTEGPGLPELCLGLLALVGSIVLAWRVKAAWARAMLAWAWIWFLPISHLISPVHILVADRFAYLWSLAACAGVAWLLSIVPAKLRFGAIGAVVCVLAIGTIRAEQAWTSSLELYANAHAVNPADPRWCENYASELFAQGRRSEAMKVLARGLAANPEHPYLLAKQAQFYELLQRRPEALASAARAAASGHASTMWIYAKILADEDRFPEAIDYARRAAVRRADTPKYTWTLVEILLDAGRAEEAESVMRAYTARSASSGSAMLFARVLIVRKRFVEAEVQLAIAEQLGATDRAVAAVRAMIPR